MKRIVLFISHKYPKLYGFLYLILFFLMLIAGAFLPYVYKGIVYSTMYEKEEACGTIKKVICVEEEITGKRRTTTVYSYFFKIDDYEVAVRPSDCREHEVGDTFDYYIYSRNDEIKAEIRNYTLAKGIFGLLAEIAVFFVVISYMCVDTRKHQEGEGDKEEPEKINSPVSYDILSISELYELCCKRNIKVIHGKRNNREYLERCLRSNDESYSYNRKWKRENEKKNILFGRIMIALIVGCIIIIICNYMKAIYYFIYLFT